MPKIVSKISGYEGLRRAALARSMEEPLFSEAVEEVRSDLAMQILNCPDEKDRTELYYVAKALDLVTSKLKSYINDIGTTDAA